MSKASKRILSLCIALSMAIGLTGCVYPDNVMFSAHQKTLYDVNNTAKNFPGITDSAYGRGLPDYGDSSLNDQFDVTIAYWAKDDGNPDTENLCGGQTMGIAGDYDALPQGETGQPCIRLPVVMTTDWTGYDFTNNVFLHDIQIDGESLSIAAGTLGLYNNNGIYAYFFIQFYPQPQGNTQTFEVNYYDEEGDYRPEYSGNLTVTFVHVPAVQLNSSTLPDGTENMAYHHDISGDATGGAAPYSFVLADGSTLPTGLSLSPSGVISGTPAQAVTGHSFDVTVTDSKAPTAQAAAATYVMTIAGHGPVSGPSVSHSSLRIVRGSTAAFTVSLGQNGNQAVMADITSEDPGIATATPTSITGGTVTVTGIAAGSTRIKVSFSGGTATPTDLYVPVTVTSPHTPTDPDDSDSAPVVPAVPATLTVDAARAKAALDAMQPGEANARIAHTGSINALAEAWRVFGQTPVIFDTVEGEAVQVRITVGAPHKLTTDRMTSGFVSGSAVNSPKALFQQFFQNKVQVVHLEQAVTFGQPVEVAAKVDLSGMELSKLTFYSYDNATNVYRQIMNPSRWVDKNGYLHFTTTLAGDIVISDGALMKK